MENDLLPCPFCGGEGELCTYYGGGEHNETVHTVMCDNEDCPMNVLTPDYLTEAEAIEAWNTRAERTCRNTSDSNYFRCSVCRKKTYRGDETFKYCPNCGAKVVE